MIWELVKSPTHITVNEINKRFQRHLSFRMDQMNPVLSRRLGHGNPHLTFFNQELIVIHFILKRLIRKLSLISAQYFGAAKLRITKCDQNSEGQEPQGKNS